MEERRRHNWLTYRMEMLVIRLRDRLRPPRDVLVEAGVEPGMSVLDFGCGPGGFSLAAARLVGPEGGVHAVDVQPAALQRVRRLARRDDLSNLHAVGGEDVAALPGESMDIALLYDVLHVDPNPAGPRSILAAVHRLLKPDGIVSVSDHHMTDEQVTDLLTAGGLFSSLGRRGRTLRFARSPAGEEA